MFPTPLEFPLTHISILSAVLKIFFDLFTRKEWGPDNAFLVRFGKRSFVHNIFLVLFIQNLAKRRKMWSSFILRKKQIYILHPFLKQALALTVSCAAPSSLLPLFWWIKTTIDLLTMPVNLLPKIVGRCSLGKRGKLCLYGHLLGTLCRVFFSADFNWDTQRFLSLAMTCLNPFVHPPAGNSSLTPIHPNLWRHFFLGAQ